MKKYSDVLLAFERHQISYAKGVKQWIRLAYLHRFCFYKRFEMSKVFSQSRSM